MPACSRVRSRAVALLPGVLAGVSILVLLGTVAAGFAQTTVQATPAVTPAEQPNPLLEEIKLFAYIENSYVWNLGGNGRGNVNELRFYDYDGGYSFNMAEFSAKKDPSERYPFGFGLVLTAGLDAQKNHALGIFRDEDDTFPFRNTPAFDLQELYLSYKVPFGTGLTLKAGKFVTMHGYEVIEAPSNLNFSRSYFFSFGIPLTHVGLLASYSPVEWLTLTAGPIVGWDVAKDNNDAPSGHGQITMTPVKDLTTALNFVVGPEQSDNDDNLRALLDLVVAYTGIKSLTLAMNAGYGREQDDPSLVAARTRQDTDVSWWGIAGYAAYDWTDKLRTAARIEYFQDTDGVRTAAVAPGKKLGLWATTATLQYKIWRGLVARLEYRHDEADEKVFKVTVPGRVPTARTMDTLTLDVYYLFF